MHPLAAGPVPAVHPTRFFARVAEFICAQSAAGAYRAAARDKPLRQSLWAPHWSALREASERDATLFMCFLLACATLHVDVPRAAAAVRQSSDPALSMKLFLSERGLLRLSAFDPPMTVDPTPLPDEAAPMTDDPRSVSGEAPGAGS